MNPTPGHLKDLWSDSQHYRDEYQSADEVREIVELLDLESAAALADVGCGNGRFSLAAAKRYPQLKVYAYDALRSAIKEFNTAAADLPAERFAIGIAPAEELPIESGAADRALCRAVLHHVEQPERLYTELARILAPGGLLLLQTPCNFWEPKWSQFMTDFHMLMDDSHRRQYHTPAAMIVGLAAVGLPMHRTDCWPYTMGGVSDAQRALIEQHGAAERLKLRQTGNGWAVEFYWARILARKH